MAVALDSAAASFLESIHRAHLDNAKTVYTASPRGNSASPLTNFVFETFLFNSLYSVNWFETRDKGELVRFDVGRNGPRERNKQKELVKFCRNNVSVEQFNLAFRPLASLGELDQSWTSVTDGDRISSENGQTFFETVSRLAHEAELHELQPTQINFDAIDECLYFIYLVRNNIFHGQKRLGVIYDRNQLKRLTVYDLFLRCVNSLLFLAVGKQDFGSAYAQFPIQLDGKEQRLELSAEQLLKLTNRIDFGIKQEDSWLYQEVGKAVQKPSSEITEGDAMFYPSAGKDCLFPILVGLQFCTDFHFFDVVRPRHLRAIVSSLRIAGITPVEKTESSHEVQAYEFEFDQIRRRLFFHKRNNLEFEGFDVALRFYFRRGDSPGEGGSGQLFDRESLPGLLRTKASASGVFVLTDGEPGGLPESLRSKLRLYYPPNSHREREYFLGSLASVDLAEVVLEPEYKEGME